MAAEIAISTAAELAPKAAESAYGWLKQQLSYVFKFQSYINDLKKQVEDLRKKRETVEKPVEEAKRQGKEIYEVVKDWLSDVEKFTEKVAKAIIEDEDKANKGGCFKLGSRPNLIQRYKRGKEAVKATKYGADLLGKGNYSEVSYRPALQRTESMYVRDYETFDSREQAFQEIIEALQDVNINMIGVWGMGGVGKTTLVKKVAWEVKENKLFDEVVIAEATQTPDYRRIQEKVAYELGLQFRNEGEYERTGLLRNKIKKQKNLLLILDNIWTKLDLDAIGIPFGGVEKEKDEEIRPCTILFTSRNRDVLSKHMKTQKDIVIDPLSPEDAWNWFHKIVGDDAESSDFHPVAVEIVRKCAGLPLAISTIANALKNQSLHAWESVLAQLKRSNPRHILDMDETLYSTIALSYKFLKNEEAKSLFLLCALYNAGNSVFIDDLLKYSMGWNLFGDVSTLEEGRNILHTLIDLLKASCLLLDGTYDNTVKMHDMIHAVAVSIASREKLMFNIQDVTSLKEVLGEKISKDSIAISLPYRNINDDLPERLEYPKLKLFFLFGINLSLQIPDAFFEKMKKLRVLRLSGLRFLPLPSSISFLKNLQTLFLKSCILEDIRILGELSKLEILSLVGSNIEELPKEIGQLTRLKLLDLSNCFNLKYIATNVISCLSQLQELYMGDSIVQWEVEGVNNQGQRNASLEELKQLSNLTALHLHIQDAQVMPQDLFFKKLKSYKIFIGDIRKWSLKSDISISKMFKLKINDRIHWGDGVKSLLKMTEDLSLEGMNGATDVISELSVDGFPHVKHLNVKDDLEHLYIIKSLTGELVFPNVESLILGNWIKLEKICHGQLNAGSFRKLRIIKVKQCDRLEYLFTSFIAKNFVQLREIKVTDCKNLKEIFGEENNGHGDEIETDDNTEFNQLCSLALQRLPKFIKIGSNMRVVIPRLENLKVCSINFENTCIDQPLVMLHYSRCLKSLTVEECNGLKFLFSSSMVKSLNQLQELLIRNCKSMEVIIDSKTVQKEEKIIDRSFSKLLYVELKVLPRLTSFGAGNSIEFPSLKKLHIERCSSLKTFFNKSVFPETEGEPKEEVNSKNYFTGINLLFDEKVAFPSLEEMVLLHLDNLQLIWHNQKLHVESFRKLKVIRVESCEKLLSIVSSITQGDHTFHNLERLNVKNCWSMKSLFPVSISTGLDQLQEIEVKNCALIEEIIQNDEGKKAAIDKIFIPHLKSIVLELLPDLRNFYSGSNHLECPSLKSIFIANCPKMETFVFSDLRTDHFDHNAPLFNEKVAFPSLEEMVLLHLDNLQLIWHNRKLHVESFRKLKVVRVESCEKLLSIVSSITQGDLTFRYLERLNVKNCWSMKSLFPVSTATRLVQLKELRIRSCGLEKIVSEEEVYRAPTFLFPQLTDIHLENLQELKCFYPQFHAIEWPMLRSLGVYKCKIKLYASEFPSFQAVDRERQPAPFSLEKIGFRNIDYVKDSEFPTLKENIWNDGLPVSSYYSLKWLVLDEVFDMSSVFPFHVFNDLRNLETLEVRNCHSLKDLFDIKGKTLKNNKEEILGFNNLKSLKVHNCSSLRSVFAHPMVLGLDQLQEIEVKNCALIEEIIQNDEGKKAAIDKILIPHLKSIVLELLPDLRNFYSGSNYLECPSLKCIVIANCPKMETFVFSDLKTDHFDHNASLFNEKVVFPSLENMELLHLDNLQLIWHNQKLHVESFCKLKVVRVDSCEKLLSIVSFNTQGHLTLHNLESLNVMNCWSMKSLFPVSSASSLVQLKELRIYSCGLENIISEEEVNRVPTFLFPQLTLIHLECLRELKCFYPRLHTIWWPLLRSLCVYKCNKINLYPSKFPSLQAGEGVRQPADILLEKVVLPSLETFCFQNLTTLIIDGFDNVQYLFPSSMVKSLFKLRELDISNCMLMERVIIGEDEGRTRTMLFPKLYELTLRNLPKLTTFCNSTANSVEMSSLFELWIDNCPGIQTFVSSHGDKTLSSKELEGMSAKENSTHMHSLFDKKIRLPSLEILQISHADQLVKLWNDQVLLDSFGKLNCLFVQDCKNLASVFPSNMLGKCQKLEILKVKNCDSVEEIFEVLEKRSNMMEEVVPKWEEVPRFVFSKLTKLHLEMLPSLKSFYADMHISEWPILKVLKVYGCNNVEILASELLSIRGSHGDSQQTLFFVYKDAFPSLEKLELCEMPSLKHLWRGNFQPCNAFQNLQTLKVSECDSLENSWSSSLTFQNLTILQVSKCDGLRYLLTPSKTQTLGQLTRMNVSDCKQMEEIITHLGDEVMENSIVFSKLGCLELHCLSSLKSFCCGDYSLEFPSLKKVIVRQCLEMETFCHGVLSIPMFVQQYESVELQRKLRSFL